MVISVSDFNKLLKPLADEAEIAVQRDLAQQGLQQSQMAQWSGLGALAPGSLIGVQQGLFGISAESIGTNDPRLVTSNQYERQREQIAAQVFQNGFEHKQYSKDIKVTNAKKAIYFNRINEQVLIDYYGVSRKDEPLDELRIEVAQWLNN